MKLIKITHYDTQWSSDYKDLMIHSEAKEFFINLEFITTVSPRPVVGHSGRDCINLHYVKTSIPNGRGLNGVDYSSYYVTDETYQKIIENVEVIG